MVNVAIMEFSGITISLYMVIVMPNPKVKLRPATPET